MKRHGFILAICAILILATGWVVPVRAHDIITTSITWNREISAIFKARCMSCHVDGGTAFSLTTYKDAFAWKTAIRDEVLQRTMPPWGAVKGFGEFRNDQALTPEQVELVTNWILGGAPEGDLPENVPSPAAPMVQKETGWDKDEPNYRHPASELLVRSTSGAFTILHGFDMDGIWPKDVPAGASFRITAQFPNGRIEPLLWLMDYKPQFDHPFLLRSPLKLPAGTIIQGIPKGVGVLLLPEKKS